MYILIHMMYIQYLVMYILEFCDDSATCKCHKHLIMTLQWSAKKTLGTATGTQLKWLLQTSSIVVELS